VECRDLHLSRVLGLGLESVDNLRFLQRVGREVTEVLLQDLDASRRRIQATNSGRSEVTLEIRVEETRHVLKICRSPPSAAA